MTKWAVEAGGPVDRAARVPQSLEKRSPFPTAPIGPTTMGYSSCRHERDGCCALDFAASLPRLGRWMTVSSIVGPSRAYLDRCVIGVVSSTLILARVVSSLVQAVGRADLMAKLHLAEILLNPVARWAMIPWNGVLAAAIDWAARAIRSGAVLFAFAWRVLPEARPLTVRFVWSPTTAGAVFAAAVAVATTTARVAFTTFVPAGFASFAWCVVLNDDERRRFAYPLAGSAGRVAP